MPSVQIFFYIYLVLRAIGNGRNKNTSKWYKCVVWNIKWWDTKNLLRKENNNKKYSTRCQKYPKISCDSLILYGWKRIDSMPSGNKKKITKPNGNWIFSLYKISWVGLKDTEPPTVIVQWIGVTVTNGMGNDQVIFHLLDKHQKIRPFPHHKW